MRYGNQLFRERRALEQARAENGNTAGELRSKSTRITAAAQDADDLQSLDDSTELCAEAARIVALLDRNERESQVQREGEEFAELVADRVVDAVTERLISLELH